MDDLNREKIDLYILHKMDKKTRQNFESEMAADPVLKQEVQLQKEAFELLDVLGDQKMRSKLDQIHDKVIGDSKTGFNKRRLALLLFLGLIVLLGFIYYFFLAEAPAKTLPQYYAQYYEAYPISFANRSEELTLDLQQVNALYKNQQYQKALPLIENLLTQNADTKLQMAAGISALQTGSYEKALNYFNDLINRKDPLYQNQATWYAAMTALKSDNSILAKQYLQSLVDSENSFKKQESQEILKKIK